MTDNFQDIAQGIVDGINSLFTPQTPAAAPSAAPSPAGHVTVAVATPPAATAAPAVPPLCGQHKPCTAQPGVWTPASMTAEILRNEGGYVCDPADPGGATNFGCTIGFISYHRDLFGLADRKGPITPDDVKHITAAQAANAYIRYFYQAAHYDLVPNVSNIPMQLYDMAVNMGVRERDGESQATRILQKVIGSAVNGVLDMTTINRLNAAIKASTPAAVNNQIVEGRIAFYQAVAKAKPAEAKFLPGWTNRANKYRIKP